MTVSSKNTRQKMKNIGFLCLIYITIFISLVRSPLVNSQTKELNTGMRTIVTTDPELDDNNSLIRLLLYSNEIQLEGLITSSGGAHWKGDGKGTIYQGETEADRFGLDLCPCKEWRWYDQHIQDVVDAYGKIYDNLKVHDPRYPEPEKLRSLIRVGNIAFPGDISAPSAGSKLIKDALLDNQPGKIFLQAWGGPSTIARALLSIEEEYADTEHWQAVHKKISQKAIITAFGEQDSSYRDYIVKSWPDIQFWQLATHIWGYGTRDVVLHGDEKYLSAEWMQKNVSSKGKLGESYRVWGDGKQMVEGDIFDHFEYRGLTKSELEGRGQIVWTPIQKPGAFISEGDTSAFLNLLDNGLRSYQHPGWGGWGGRAVQGGSNFLWGAAGGQLANNDVNESKWEGMKAVDYNEFNGARADYAAARWFAAAQNDFAARLNWSITDEYKKANHHPEIQAVPQSINVLPGKQLELRALVSDPDGDTIELHWWQYREAGTYPESVSIAKFHQKTATVTIPPDAQPGQSIHVILEATDNGRPALKRYHRVVLNVVKPPQ
jgi:hypothetical protein